MYLDLTTTKSYQDAWLINFGASYHMTPNREWFYEYEKFDSGDVLLGDYSLIRIVG